MSSIWCLSDKGIFSVWRVGDDRFATPSNGKVKFKEAKIVGSSQKMTFIGQELGCDIFRSDIEIDDSSLARPDAVLRYEKFYNQSKVLIAALREKLYATVQESRELCETPEIGEESSPNNSVGEIGNPT